MRHRRLFGSWAPYEEMKQTQWIAIFNLLKERNAKLTVGITASWVTKDAELIPFPKRFPDEAAVLREGLEEGLLEIANHGLTHCVLKNKKYKPKIWRSNRIYHREFWEWIDDKTHTNHIKKAQEILQEYFKVKITTLIPPGNVFALKTIKAARQNGIKLINCQTVSGVTNGLKIIGNENVIAFHDREIVLEGVKWLKEKFSTVLDNKKFCFVKELK